MTMASPTLKDSYVIGLEGAWAPFPKVFQAWCIASVENQCFRQWEPA